MNVGSTSVKTRLFDADLQTQAVLCADYGGDGLVLDGVDLGGKALNYCGDSAHDAQAALTMVLAHWRRSLDDKGVVLAAIGHRVVHGADWFDTLTPISQDVLNRLAQLDSYAPLHNPLNRLGIQSAADLFPGIAQFAVFDTAFHCHLPDVARRYAIPENLSASVAFYRYGFHGISCQYSVAAVSAGLGCEPAQLNLIVLHLGGGASITAIRAGVSVDTSMGFSPTEGLIMGSRCGDIDPMIALTLQRQGMSLEQLDDLLNHGSGLYGLCGDTDMRRILERAQAGDGAAEFAVNAFCYRIKKYIGAYCAILGKVDALVFTGGIGEHAAPIRERIITGLEPLGMLLDRAANAQLQPAGSIGDNHSRVKLLVVHAQEEREIARQILTFLDENVRSSTRG
jgi:acetate kinase